MTDSPTLSYTPTCKIPTLCLKPDKGICQSLPVYVIIGNTPVGSITNIQNVFLPVMPANLLVIVEFACHGDLLGYLLKSRGLPDTYYQTTGKLTRVTAKKMMMFAWQIADGMNFLAENKVKRVKENYTGQNEKKSYLNFHRSPTKGWIRSTARSLGHPPFTRENRKFQFEEQMVRAIPFGKLQRIWALICVDAIFLLF